MSPKSKTHPVVVVEADGLEAVVVLQHLEHVGRDERGQLRAQVDVLDAEVQHGQEDGHGCCVLCGCVGCKWIGQRAVDTWSASTSPARLTLLLEPADGVVDGQVVQTALVMLRQSGRHLICLGYVVVVIVLVLIWDDER